MNNPRRGVRTPLTFGLMFALVSCAVGPDYKRPETKDALPQQFAEELTGERLDTSQIAEDWWKQFQDGTLNELVQAALKNNFDLRLAAEKIEQADAALGEAKSNATTPKVTGSLAQSTSPNPANGQSITTTSTALSASFELDFWGRLRRTREALRAQLQASVYGREVTRLSLVAMVTQYYFTLRSLDVQILSQQDNLKYAEESLRVTRRRSETGLATPNDLYQAQSLPLTLQRQIIELSRQRTLALHYLALLTVQPELKIDAGDIRSIALPLLPRTGLPATLLERRPDLRQTEQQLASTTALIGAYKAAALPTISLTGSLGVQSSQFNGNTNTGTTSSLGLSAQLFDAGAWDRAKSASAQQKQALTQYLKALQVAFNEVRDALSNNQAWHDADQSAQDQLKAAQTLWDSQQARYKQGLINAIDVASARRSYNDALVVAIQIRTSRLISNIDMFKSLGGGWQE